MRLLLLYCLLIALPGAHAATTAFVDVSVVPMSREELLEHQTVLVEGDRIRVIGPAAQVAVPAGSRVIDGRHRFLLPGLVDMHVHFVRRPQASDSEVWRFPDYAALNRRFGLLFVAHGVTAVRTLHAHPAGDALWRRSKTPGWLGPVIYPSGPMTDGDPPVWPVSRVVTTAAEARRAVHDDVAHGYVALKVYDGLSLAAYDQIVAEARTARLDIVGHVPDAVGLEHAIESHQATIEHLDSFLGSLQAGNVPYRPPASLSFGDLLGHVDMGRLGGFADRLREAGVWTCPTLVVYDMDSSGPQAAEMRYVPAATTRKLVQRYGPSQVSREAEVRFGLEAIRILHAHGAGLLLGSDAFKLNVVPGFSALKELRNFVQAGLTPYEALRAGTVNAAQALHAQDEFGSVAEGRRADLLLLEANPLENIDHLERRAGVMLRGRWLPAAELAQALTVYERR